MDTEHNSGAAARLRHALAAPLSSDRLQAALSAGTYPDPHYVEPLIEQCAIEPDFYVRDMLSWSLTRHPDSITVPRLLAESEAERSQARSQALHTLSKIGDPRGWDAITPELLRDPDAEVVKSAWRAAVILAPESARAALAVSLSTQLGRGDRSLQLSLGRALAALGEVALAALAEAAAGSDENVRVHAIASERLVRDPEESFDAAIFEARRLVALSNAPKMGEELTEQ